jgi:hypothetical protein
VSGSKRVGRAAPVKKMTIQSASASAAYKAAAKKKGRNAKDHSATGWLGARPLRYRFRHHTPASPAATSPSARKHNQAAVGRRIQSLMADVTLCESTTVCARANPISDGPRQSAASSAIRRISDVFRIVRC